MFIIAAMLFQVLENFAYHPITNPVIYNGTEDDRYNFPYQYDLSLYFIFITCFTIGYGDFMPATW